MFKYRTAEELARDKEVIGEHYKERVSWGGKESFISNWIQAHIPRDAAVLDIAAGAGQYLAKLKSFGYSNLSGTDVNDYLDTTVKGYLKKFAPADLNKEPLPFEANSFDLVTALAVAEHLENAFQFARECARVLRPGGCLILTLPNIFRISSIYKLLSKGELQGYHSGNDHIMVLPEPVVEKCFLGLFEKVETFYSPAYLKIPFTNKKLRSLPPNRFLSTKIGYIIRKK